jgi:predicted negative regulator of RcsB-dependent stress response
VRTNEPGGYLGLARALIKTGELKEAGEVISQILQRGWPSHFGDVHGQAQQVQGELDHARQ